jgi:adenylate cyclase
LFTDIEAFTTIAESHSAEETTQHLTEYFELILETIRKHGGEVNQLMGDGVVAYWGAPAENLNHATDAVRAVLECHGRLTDLNPRWETQGKPALPTRFGLATGEVVVGNVGSPSRLAYVAVGDPANLASRIEGLNRFYGTRLLVAGPTRAATGSAFEWRHVDGVRAKGKSEVVELFEPLGARGGVPARRLDFRDRYEAALMEYRRRDFLAALRQLDGFEERERRDPSVERLRILSEEYLKTPPPNDWDGVTNFQEK